MRLLIILSLSLLASCVATKSDMNYVSEQDYNKRITVKGVHYDKILTPIGYSSIAVTTVAGAYVGYESKLIPFYFIEKRSANVASGLFGAAIGFTGSYLINRALGWGKVKSVDKPEKWIKKFDKNLILVNKINDTEYYLINKKIEPDYLVKNLKDVKDFSVVFTNSLYVDNLLHQTINNSGIYRDEYMELLTIYPNNKYMLDMKKQYILKSINLSNMFTAYDRFPETKLKIDSISVNIVNDFNDAILYNKRFSSNKYSKQVLLNGISSGFTCSNILELRNEFKSNFDINNNDLYSLKFKNNTKRNYLKARLCLVNTLNFKNIDDVYAKYSWLGYENIEYDILSEYYNVGLRNCNEISCVTGKLNSLTSNNSYKNYKINNSLISSFITEKKSRIVAAADSCMNLNQLNQLNIKHNYVFKNEIAQSGVKYVIADNSLFDTYKKYFSNTKYLIKHELFGYIEGEYIGGFLNNLPNGRGVYKSKSDSYYIGNFKNGSLNDLNAVIIRDVNFSIDKYEGKVIDNLPNGYGKAKGRNLSKFIDPLNIEDISYEGNWKNGRPDGQGKFSGKGDTWIEGQFSNGYLQGSAQIRLGDGIGVRIYGNFNSGEPNGDFTFKKWTLLGLMSSTINKRCNSWDEVLDGAKSIYKEFNKEWIYNNSSNNSNHNRVRDNEQKATNKTDKCKIKEVVENTDSFFSPGGITYNNSSDYKYFLVYFEDNTKCAVHYRPSKNKWFVSSGSFLGEIDWSKKEYSSKQEAINALLKECEKNK